MISMGDFIDLKVGWVEMMSGSHRYSKTSFLSVFSASPSSVAMGSSRRIKDGKKPPPTLIVKQKTSNKHINSSFLYAVRLLTAPARMCQHFLLPV